MKLYCPACEQELEIRKSDAKQSDVTDTKMKLYLLVCNNMMCGWTHYEQASDALGLERYVEDEWMKARLREL